MESWWGTWERLMLGEARYMSIAVLVLILATLVELRVPAEPGQGFASRGRNVVYALLFKVVGGAGIALCVVLGPGVKVVGPPAGPLEAVALVLANLLAIDLLYYAYHRAQHRFAFLWAIHELHHADSELNATTSFRTYWLEAPVQTILVATPTALLFGYRGEAHALAVLTISYGFLIFSHCNFRLSLGPLTSWICGPQVHRVHHSTLAVHRDRNFAQFFPFIDRLFGTYHAPARGEFPPTGAEGLASDAPFGLAFIQPFRIWAGQSGQSASRRGRV